MYRALKSFSGLVSMRKGEVKEIKNEKIVKDLLRARYIEEVKTKAEPKTEIIKSEHKVEAEPKEEIKETKKKTTKRKKTPKKEG